MIKIRAAALAPALLMSFVCATAHGGDLIIVAQASGGVATAPPDPAIVNRDATIDNANRARMYGDPSKETSHNIIVIDPNGSENSASDKNREATIRNRQRAKAQSQGKDANKNNTLIILPGTASSQAALDAAMDRAHALSDGEPSRRPCTTASVSVGTVGGVTVVDRAGDNNSINTVAVGGCR